MEKNNFSNAEIPEALGIPENNVATLQKIRKRSVLGMKRYKRLFACMLAFISIFTNIPVYAAEPVVTSSIDSDGLGTMEIPVTVSYYFHPYVNPYDTPEKYMGNPDQSELVKVEEFKQTVPIKREMVDGVKTTVNTPIRINLDDYDISEGMKAVADKAGVAVEDLTDYYPAHWDEHMKASFVRCEESFDIAAKTLDIAYENDVPVDTDFYEEGVNITIHLRVRAKATVTVHHTDEEGNTIHEDTKYSLVEDGNKHQIDFLEEIPGYAPIGGGDNYFKIYDADAKEYFSISDSGKIINLTTGIYQGGVWQSKLYPTSLRICSAVSSNNGYDINYIFKSGNYEITALYRHLPVVEVYNVIDDDFDHAAKAGSVMVAPNARYRPSVDGSEAVSLLADNAIGVPKLTGADKILKYYTVGKNGDKRYFNNDDFYVNEDVDIYICYTRDSAHTHTYKTQTAPASPGADGALTEICSCGDVKSRTVIYAPKTVRLSKTSCTYNGKAQRPKVTVEDSKGRTLAANTDYTVKYQSGCKNVGSYTVTVTLKGKYSGTMKAAFEIVPKGTSLSKITAKKKALALKWKKQTSGYEIQYSTSRKFTKKTTKTVTVGKNKITAATISNLKAKKQYYVRVRTYKTVKVDKKNIKLYSAWSKAKSAKTKNS